MMNDDDDDEIILDDRGLNQFNIGVSDEPKKLSKEKWIILVITCIAIV